MKKNKEIIIKNGLLKHVIDSTKIQGQALNGKLRFKLIEIRSQLQKLRDNYLIAINEVKKEHIKVKDNKFQKKGEEFLYKKGKSKEKLQDELKELANIEIKAELPLLTKEEFQSLILQDETLIFVTDTELNPSL